ncbi:MAG TPA: flagellar FlbD family protein [Vicinamibacterales bacterium]|nr:flagellar FlbD family protein [Vicinamibacterales bacterium]
MIAVTRLDGSAVVVNADLIERIEPAPDTLLALTTGVTMRVRESAPEIIARIVAFRRQVSAMLPAVGVAE